MECRTARLLLELAHPQGAELESADADALERHLTSCSECGALARAERRVDSVLATAMREVPIPAGLRGTIKGRLAAERANRARRLWWQRGRWVAAAASLLLVIGAWWLLRPLPTPSLTDIHAENAPRHAQDVAQRLAALEFPDAVPPHFNYGLLISLQAVEFQGQSRVPYLIFHDGRGENYVAEVFILSARRFNRDAALEQERVDSGGLTVEVREHPDNPRVFYLIRYTGGSLQRFLTSDTRPAT